MWPKLTHGGGRNPWGVTPPDAGTGREMKKAVTPLRASPLPKIRLLKADHRAAMAVLMRSR